ncbi:MAG TPA: type II toxin-antitoxin system HicA family toxin, partial [Solirubrobacteraceae bacterium]|nr:type II toxin-antitoxin system HicA family toxin [Solirubrobacteraceae bacterium]
PDRPVRSRSSDKVYVKVRVMIKLIERDGWRQVRQSGSHRQFHHPIKSGTVTVAGHRNQDLRPKTQADIFRQAGLKR